MADSKSHASSRSKAVLGGKGKSKSKGSKHHPHEIRIRKGKSGGHIVTHHELPDENGMTPDPEEHVMPDQDALLQHIQQNTDNSPAPQAPDPNAAAAQAGPPAAGAGAPPPPGM